MRNGHPQLFLSYNHSDRIEAEKVAGLLRERGVSCWLDASELAPGDNWEDRMFEAIRGADAFVSFVSPGRKDSRWQLVELGAALIPSSEGKLRLLPVLLPGATAADVPGPLRRFKPISEPTSEAVAERIAEALAAAPVAAV